MSTRALLLASMIALSLHTVAAQAQTPEQKLPQLAQELFLAETVYPQEEGEVQLTLHARLDGTTRWRLLGEYGLSDRFQVSLATSTMEQDTEGRSVELGFLYALLPSEIPFTLSASGAVKLAEGHWPRWEPSLIAAKRWGRLQVHGSFSAELGETEGALSGTVAALLDAGRLTPTLEWAGSTGEEHFLAPGLFVHLRDGLEVGFGVPMSLLGGTSARGAHVMLTLEF